MDNEFWDCDIENNACTGDFLVEMALKQVPGGARQKVQRISMGTVSTGVITGIVTPTHVCV